MIRTLYTAQVSQNNDRRFKMYRDIFTNQWIIGVISFLLILSGVCYFYYQWTTAPYRKQASESQRPAKTTKPIEQDTQTFSLGETAARLAEAKGKNKVVFNLDKPLKKKGEIRQTGVTETIKQEEAAQSDTGVSPYGFGPYPEIPADFPFPVEWEFPGSDADHELMARVAIKLWSQGIETMGATAGDGLVYPNYIDTVYIRWDETIDDDGNPIQYISGLGGYPPACLRIVENNIARLGERGTMTAADIPSDVTVILYDEAGIDPYTFLELPK